MLKKIEAFLDKPLTVAHALAGILGFFLGIIIMFFTNTANAAEFEKGNNYTILYVQGFVHLTCQQNIDGRFITRRTTLNCQDYFVSPSSYSRFITQDSKAVKVQIFNNTNNYSKTKRPQYMGYC